MDITLGGPNWWRPFLKKRLASAMWQSGGMGAHAANNPWMKLMGIVHKERRHHDSGGTTTTAQVQIVAGTNERALNQ